MLHTSSFRIAQNFQGSFKMVSRLEKTSLYNSQDVNTGVWTESTGSAGASITKYVQRTLQNPQRVKMQKYVRNDQAAIHSFINQIMSDLAMFLDIFFFPDEARRDGNIRT